MKRRGPRLILDIALSAMLVFEMFYTLTGNLLHEVVGVAFFVTLIAHMVLSRRWFTAVRAKSAASGGLPVKQRIQSVIAVATAAVSAVLLVSSVLISSLLTETTGLFLAGSGYSVWSLIHTVSAYGLCGLAICHVGAHWVSLFKALRVPYDPARRRAVNTGVMSVAALGVVAVSAAAAKAVDGWSVVAGTCQRGAFCNEANVGEKAAGLENDSEDMAESNIAERNGESDGAGRGYGKRLRAQRGSQSAEGGNGFSEAMPDSSAQGGSSSGSSGSGSSSGSNSSGSTTSICTLCGKRCPLTAPRCNKPYAAGLI